MLELKNADVFYGKAQALHGVSIACAPNEVLALVGRNGAGKSTTLRAMMGRFPCGRGSASSTARTSRACRCPIRAGAASRSCPTAGTSSAA